MADAPFPAGMVETIQRFLENDHQRTPGLDLYPEVFETDLFFPLQRQAELEAMVQLARKVQPTTVMDVGSDKGSGVYHWAKCLPSVKNVIACEIRGTPYRNAFEKAFPKIDFLWLEASSHDQSTVDKVKEWLCGKPIDVLFLDGDKANFFKDFHCYLPFMSGDGIVFMHDIQDSPEPSNAFRRIAAEYPNTERIIIKDDWIRSQEREARGIPPDGPHEAWLRFWKGRSAGVGVIWLNGRAR